MAMRIREVWCPVLAVTLAAATTVAGVGAVQPSHQRSQQKPPPLRAQVDLLAIDVQVAPGENRPFRSFAAADFAVRISGRDRPVVSLTFLHLDDGPVARTSLGHSDPDCVFGFRRKTDRPTAHYVVAVERIGADRTEVKRVEVELVDKAFAVQWVVYRTPIRRGDETETDGASRPPNIGLQPAAAGEMLRAAAAEAAR